MFLKKCVILVVSSFLFLIFFSPIAQAADTAPSNLDCSGGFFNLFPGNSSIKYKPVTFTSPRRIPAHVVKVDLNDPNIDTATTPRQWLGNTTSGFLSMVGGGVLAINGSGFLALNDPMGFNASQGDVYSGNQGDGGMIYSSSEDNSVEKLDYSLASNPPWDVLSGVNLLVEGGNIYDKLISCTNPDSPVCKENDCDSYCTIRARTSIGLTNNNQLIIIVTEEGSSQLLDMAEMMKQCGSVNAMNMDGGGSSTLAADPSNITGKSIINNLAGSERTVSNHLAICFGTCDVPVSAENNPIPEGNPIPPPYVPCNETDSPEFHSLRPYQASPCNKNKEDLALFCGNDLFVGDNITISKFTNSSEKSYYRDGSRIYPYKPPDGYYSNVCYYCSSTVEYQCVTNPSPCIPETFICDPNGDTSNCGLCKDYPEYEYRTESCAFSISANKSVAVDVSGAEYPIMGYTEPSQGNNKEYKVINSQNETDENVSNATKMNEYVSWYLNGVNGRAEYSYLNPDLQCVGESTGKVGSCMQTQVNSSGGLDCLGTWGIPFMTPFVQISLTTDGKSVCTGEKNYCCVSKILPSHTDDTPGSGNIVNYSGPIKKLLPFSLQNTERVSEISDAELSVNNNAGIRHNQVVGCDTGSIFSLILNIVGLDNVHIIKGAPTNCYGSTFLGFFDADFTKNIYRLTDFLGAHSPPIEEAVEYLGEKFDKWLMDYKHWRGNTCISLPIYLNLGGGIDFTVNYCFDNPAFPNIFGNIFSYIPFSSTEDRMGDVRMKAGAVSFIQYSPNVQILWSQVTPKKDADLFVPHMEEDTQLANLLQKTYAYKDADLTSMENSGFIPDSPYCEFRETRSNPGDDLFAGELKADIAYTAQITCNFLNWGGSFHGVPGATTPYGNLCENLVGGTCVGITADPNRLYTETVYGLPLPAPYYGYYDCEWGSNYKEYCVVGGTAIYNPPPFPDPTDCEYNPEMHCVPRNFIGADCSGRQTCNNDYFKCVPISATCARPITEPPLQYCTNAVLANLKLEDRIPLAREAWSRLVAGSAGIFRKMFPEIGSEGSDFDGIIDMPASTDVSYRDEGGGNVYVGNPSSQTPGSQAKLYFPHIGGIKEYFLTGIQTLLRPKGMGNQPVFCVGEECKQGTGVPPITPIPIPPDSQVCDLTCENDATSMIPPGLLAVGGPVYNNVKDRAQRWLGSCGWVQSIGQRSFDELYNKIVVDSTAAGVNPVFSLAIWLHEFGASNYECVCETLGGADASSVYCNRGQDFGINLEQDETVFRYDRATGRATVLTDRFNTQLSIFLGLPLAYQSYCQSDNFACAWEQFGAIYHYGDCYSSTAANNYILEIREIYRWIAGDLAFPCYPISI